jgi:hypothetical protein
MSSSHSAVVLCSVQTTPHVDCSSMFSFPLSHWFQRLNKFQDKRSIRKVTENNEQWNVGELQSALMDKECPFNFVWDDLLIGRKIKTFACITLLSRGLTMQGSIIRCSLSPYWHVTLSHRDLMTARYTLSTSALLRTNTYAGLCKMWDFQGGGDLYCDHLDCKTV